MYSTKPALCKEKHFALIKEIISKSFFLNQIYIKKRLKMKTIIINRCGSVCRIIFKKKSTGSATLFIGVRHFG